jgi:NhaP-type Na+/H+ or K+/H+ antiporter
LFLLAIAILLLRRLPFMLACYRWIPDIRTFREAAFTGWFGPMGVGAVFIATLAKTKLPEPHEEPVGQAEILSASIQPIVFFLVLISILCREWLCARE